MDLLPASLDDAYDALVHYSSSGESEGSSFRALSPDPPTEERPKQPCQPEARLRLGERVEVRWSRDQRLYAGHIEALDENGCADVLFDDGVREARVAPSQVLRVCPSAAAFLMPELHAYVHADVELDAHTRTASPRRLPDFFPFPVIVAPWRLHADADRACPTESCMHSAPRPAASKAPKPRRNAKDLAATPDPPKAHAATSAASLTSLARPAASGGSSSSIGLVMPSADGVGEAAYSPGNRKPKRARPSVETEVMLCCHKMPHEGGVFTCHFPFGHLCPHETGPEGPRKRAPARSRGV